MIKPGWKSSEFWITAVSFIFSGLYLVGLIGENAQSIENNSPTLKGADKKTLAMTMISNFYDQVFTVVNFPFVPKLLQPIIQKYVKQILMLLVSASIDALVTTFRNAGIFDDPSNAETTEIDKTPTVSDK